MMAVQMHARAAPVAESSPALRLFQPHLPALALGLAVDHLMSKPAFATLPFGDWAQILVGQINRRHCCFVLDGDSQTVGFAGWALTERDKAEEWIAGRSPLLSSESHSGDCVVFNAWSAETSDVHTFMLAQFRVIFADKRFVYFRRHYRDGRTRSARLAVNRGSRRGPVRYPIR